MKSPDCRLCGSSLEISVIDLGNQPLANSYLEPDERETEHRYPLHARLCEVCGLVQVDDVVPASEIFTDYAYFSSYSTSWLTHAHDFATTAIKKFSLTPHDLVVEVASNDGYLLRWFVERGLTVLGIEPAGNVAAAAIEGDVPTMVKFFGEKTAREVRAEHGGAKLIVANNVLAHVPDLNDFVEGLRTLLAPDGAISIEVPHLLNLVEQTQFDTIYHEHYSYFSLTTASAALERHGLRVFDVETLPTHGGSLRIWAQHASNSPISPGAAVTTLLRREREAGLQHAKGYTAFAARVTACKDGLISFLESASDDGLNVVGYGAAAKGNTLLNFAAIDANLLPYVVDRNPNKQNRLLPGSQIPIAEPTRILVDKPDFVLILPWNLKDEIVKQLQEVRAWGGKFVTAVPSVELVE